MRIVSIKHILHVRVVKVCSNLFILASSRVVTCFLLSSVTICMYICSLEAVLFVGVFAWKFLFIVSCVHYSNFMMSEPNQARKPQSLLQLSSIFKSHKKPLFHKTGRLSSSTKVRRNSWVGFELWSHQKNNQFF